MRMVVSGVLLVVVFGCSGVSQIFEQSLVESFDQEFLPNCVDVHAKTVEGLVVDPKQACGCAKAEVERTVDDPMERVLIIADADRMTALLEGCNVAATPDEAVEPAPSEPEDVEIPQ